MTGCGSQTHPISDAQLSQLVSGITDDLQREQTDWQLQKVQQELVRECMSKKGLTYFVTDFGPVPTQSRLTSDSSLSATPDGYGIYQSKKASTAGGDGRDGSSRQEVYQQSLSATAQTAYTLAYFGGESDHATLQLPGGGSVQYPIKGCLAQTYDELYGSATEQAMLEAIPQIVRVDVDRRLQSSGIYIDALTSWRSCMSTAGYNYKSPDDAITQLEHAYTDAKTLDVVHPREVATAQADAACDARTGLRAAKRVARLDALRQESSTLEQQTLALLEIRSTAVQRARALVSS